LSILFFADTVKTFLCIAIYLFGLLRIWNVIYNIFLNMASTFLKFFKKVIHNLFTTYFKDYTAVQKRDKTQINF